MLSERQLRLVELLEQQPVMLNELARQTGVSSRTILRDIDYINFTLNGKARIQPGGSAGYLLEIADRRSYFQLLQRHDNDDRLLALLLLNAFTTRVQLASSLNLPEALVADKLVRLKQRYERTFCISSRPGVGHFVDEPEEKRIFLLANLLRKDPFVMPLPGVTPDNIRRLEQACSQATLFPLMPGEYLASLVLAVYLLRNQLTRQCPHAQNPALLNIAEQAGLYLGHHAFSVLVSLLEARQQQVGSLSEDTVISLLNSLSEVVPTNIVDKNLVENITGHLLRAIAAPVWLPEHRQSTMINLKAAWPAAFDMSLRFITLLREQLDTPIFDSDLIGLYFACALERHQNERQPIILLSDQNAIATINQMAIERDVLNCRVVIAHNLSELKAIGQEIEALLIVNNSRYLLDNPAKNIITIKNIITAAGTEQIKNHLATAFIRQYPERFFIASGSFHYSNSPTDSWQQTVGNICQRLNEQGHITQDEALRICSREQEGENLIVNHLAIPHCWSEKEPHFRGFFITLASPTQVNNEPVNHIMIACANTRASHELKIFSYLASVLYRYPPETIIGLTGYSSFIALLKR